MKNNIRSAFTIVELIVVIAVIAILAAITIVSYGAWRAQTATSAIKSDLTNVASAMESFRNFNGGYPTALSQLEFSASDNVSLLLTVPGPDVFCIDGSSSINASVHYYIDNNTRTQGATEGSCGAATQTLPDVVGGVSFVSTAGDPPTANIDVSWVLASPNYATQYLVQCSLDAGFVTGLLEETVLGEDSTEVILTEAFLDSTYFCRVRAGNDAGTSDWSDVATGNT